MESQFDKVVILLLQIGGICTAASIFFFGASIFTGPDGERDARFYRITLLPLFIIAFGCLAVSLVMTLTISMLIIGLLYLLMGILVECIFLKKIKSDKWQFLLMGEFAVFWIMFLSKLVSHYVPSFDTLATAYLVLALFVAAIYGTIRSIKDLPRQVERKKEAFFASYNVLLEKATDPHANLLIEKADLKKAIDEKYTAHSGLTLDEVYENIKSAGYGIVDTERDGQLSFESRGDNLTDRQKWDVMFGKDMIGHKPAL